MKLFASLAVAVVFLFFLDQVFNHGNYWDAVAVLLRQIARSFAFR
jgi:hypothetical protein